MVMTALLGQLRNRNCHFVFFSPPGGITRQSASMYRAQFARLLFPGETSLLNRNSLVEHTEYGDDSFTWV